MLDFLDFSANTFRNILTGTLVHMFAVIETGGKQYLVSPKQKIKIEKITPAEGEQFVFDRVLLIAEDDGEEVKIGTPHLEGATVEARVIKQGRAKKIKMLRYKSKTGRRRRKGHRQHFTEVEILEIKSAS